MKRVVVYILILTALAFIPVKGQDVADLEPIQAVWLSRQEDGIVLKTDTGDQGKGKTVKEALDNMKQQSTGIVYLDTAQFLLVSENALGDVENIRPYLKGKVLLCLWEGGKLEEAAKYLQAHEIGVKMKKWRMEDKLPKLPI